MSNLCSIKHSAESSLIHISVSYRLRLALKNVTAYSKLVKLGKL